MNFALFRFVSESEEKIPDTFSDSSGAVLTPGNPKTCEGNGNHEGYEICCDECSWFLAYFPEYCDSSYSPPDDQTVYCKYKDIGGDLPF